MTTMTAKVYSDKQHRLVRRLTNERTVPVAGRSIAEAELVERHFDLLGNHEEFDSEHDKFVSSREASAVIDWLFDQPKAQGAVGDLTPGVYELAGGEIFVVKFNRDKTRLYAKQLVEHHGDRLVESGDHRHDIEFEYAPGAIYRISPDDRMSETRGKELTIRYGKCLNCGRKLKNGVSVERGIGPVCIKSFRR